jgi:hypothetical protein
MNALSTVDRAVEHVSATQAAAAGGAGASVSIATALFLDPLVWAPWLQVATLGVGLITGVASLALVVMKIVQQRRAMRRKT